MIGALHQLKQAGVAAHMHHVLPNLFLKGEYGQDLDIMFWHQYSGASIGRKQFSYQGLPDVALPTYSHSSVELETLVHPRKSIFVGDNSSSLFSYVIVCSIILLFSFFLSPSSLS